jgi:hypothetical protein
MQYTGEWNHSVIKCSKQPYNTNIIFILKDNFFFILET